MRGIFLACGLSIIGLDELRWCMVWTFHYLIHIFGILMTSTLAWEATPAYVSDGILFCYILVESAYLTLCVIHWFQRRW